MRMNQNVLMPNLFSKLTLRQSFSDQCVNMRIKSEIRMKICSLFGEAME